MLKFGQFRFSFAHAGERLFWEFAHSSPSERRRSGATAKVGRSYFGAKMTEKGCFGGQKPCENINIVLRFVLKSLLASLLWDGREKRFFVGGCKIMGILGTNIVGVVRNVGRDVATRRFLDVWQGFVFEDDEIIFCKNG